MNEATFSMLEYLRKSEEVITRPENMKGHAVKQQGDLLLWICALGWRFGDVYVHFIE